jgi:hypothetical protein
MESNLVRKTNIEVFLKMLKRPVFEVTVINIFNQWSCSCRLISI